MKRQRLIISDDRARPETAYHRVGSLDVSAALMFYDIMAQNNNAYTKGQSAEIGLHRGRLSA
jgi:hypothetical protein